GVVWAAGRPAAAQEEGVRLEVVRVDTSDFPEIVLGLAATDSQNNLVTDFAGLRISEGDTQLTEFDTEQTRVGVELIFVIDANTTINQLDDGELSRREKVRDSIVNYARQFMSQAQEDLVTIVVPGEGGGQFLEQADLVFPNEVINAINFYEPASLSDTPINEMVQMALDHLAENQDEGRSQAILLYSDGAQLGQQLAYDALAATAQEQGVTFYGAILGSRADQSEIDNVARLTDATGGAYVHMPEAAQAAPLFETIRNRAVQTEVSYRSTLSSSGSHTVIVELGGASVTASFELTIEPPAVSLAIDNSVPIRRVAAAPDTPLEEMEPTSQPMAAEVEWPDGHPRLLEEVLLIVNGREFPLATPVLDDGGRLTFGWDIGALDAGTYDVQVRVTDELGLQGVSEPLPLTIEVERPQGAPTATVPAAATSEPAGQEEGSSSPATLGRNLLLIGGGLAGLFLLAVVAVVAVVLIRRRGAASTQAPSPGAAVSAAPPSGPLDKDTTFIMPPDFAIRDVTGAYLEPLEYAPEHAGMIPILGNNIALGRDPNLVQIPFNDRSVSRLHARIMESNSAYRLYDEGSASGTYLNYERIGLTPRVLKDKDEIHFGRVHLRFHLASAVADNDPTQILSSSHREEGTDTQVYIPRS
ncbi:MAG: FHA domain-containing protein, partial [Chloroflexi bacterium]|nr:FHA domain-containing protein [Chloroflexota bacterium]